MSAYIKYPAAASGTFTGPLDVTNATSPGTPGSPSQITTGDPDTVGLVIEGTANPLATIGPVNPTAQDIQGVMTYMSGTLTGSSAIGVWDQGFRSVETSDGDIYTEFSVANASVAAIAGLSGAIGAPPIYTSIAFALYCGGSGGGNLFVVEGGVTKHGPIPYIPADVFRVERVGTAIKYLQNGVVIYTSATASTGTLFGAYTVDGSEPGPQIISGIVIQYIGTEHQTSDLQQWKSDAGSVLASISATGELTSTNATVTGELTVNSSGDVGTPAVTINDTRGTQDTSLLIQSLSVVCAPVQVQDAVSANANIFSVNNNNTGSVTPGTYYIQIGQTDTGGQVVLDQAGNFIGSLAVTGNMGTSAAGSGLQIKEGSNARSGTAVLVGGTVSIANTSITSNTRIYVCSQIDGGVPGWLRVSARVNSTSFDVTSSSVADTSTIAWFLVEGT